MPPPYLPSFPAPTPLLWCNPSSAHRISFLTFPSKRPTTPRLTRAFFTTNRSVHRVFTCPKLHRATKRVRRPRSCVTPLGVFC